MNQLLNSVKTSFLSKVRGIISTSIPYEIRNESGDWSLYFGQYEGQKHDDLDSNCCWAYAGNELLEDQLEFLWNTGQFTDEDKKWFQDNGYIDEDGDFYLSRRFIPIISGVQRNGNDPREFWRLTKSYGAIPNKVLTYTNNSEYFDKTKISQYMYDLGKEFLNRINIATQDIGSDFARKDIKLISSALLQSELQVTGSVPHDGSWNQPKVKWTGSSANEHSWCIYKVDESLDYPYFGYDQYEPHLKQFSKDYDFGIIIKVVITPKSQIVKNPIKQDTRDNSVWRAVWDWFTKNPAWVHS